MAKDINSREPYNDSEYPTSNIVFMRNRRDTKLDDYINNHGGRWIHRGGIWCFTLSNGLMYKVVHAGDNARGYRPCRVIIDSEIDYDILQKVISPMCVCCRHMEII